MEKAIEVLRLVTFVVSFPFVIKALEKLYTEKLFRNGSTWHIRFIVTIFTVIISYLFALAVSGILESINTIVG